MRAPRPAAPLLPLLNEDMSWATDAPCTRAVAAGIDPWGSSDHRQRLQATATCVRSSCLLPCARYAEGQRWAGVVIAGWSAPEMNGNKQGNEYPGLPAVLAHYSKSNGRQMRRAINKARENPDHGASATPATSDKVAS